MRKKTRVLGALAGTVLLAAVAAGCGGTKSSSGSTVKIALEAPLTGDQASNGVDIFDGAKLAVDQANAAGGVLGKKIELLRADDRADPAAGVQVARRMVSAGVFSVIGPYNSAVGVENLKIYVDAGVVPIHLTSNSATNGLGYTVQPKDYQIAPVEAKAITGYFQAKKVGIVYDPQTYTAGIAAQVKTELEKDGAAVVAFKEEKPGLQSYADDLRAIEDGHPDLIYISTYFPQGGVIAKDLALKPASLCLMGLANQDPGFVDAAGLEAARACSFSGVPSPENFPEASGYVTDYKAKFGKDPGTWGTFSYDSVNLLLDAVKKAGSWDQASVRAKLTGTTAFKGITGSIGIDKATGNRVDVPVVILTLGADGKFIVDPKWAAFSGFGA
jgi:branched-chain amino acid transport system substrate-binding protein